MFPKGSDIEATWNVYYQGGGCLIWLSLVLNSCSCPRKDRLPEPHRHWPFWREQEQQANNWACLPALSSFSSFPLLEEISGVDRTDTSSSSLFLRIYRMFHLVGASEINYQGLTIHKLNGFLHILEDKSNTHQETHLTDENTETQSD